MPADLLAGEPLPRRQRHRHLRGNGGEGIGVVRVCWLLEEGGAVRFRVVRDPYRRVRREALIVRVGVRDHHRWSVAAGW